MTNEEMLLQTLGTNEDAKTTLANILTEYFPSVVSELSLPDRIVEKFYDWQFPFIYTTDGAGTRKWSVSVRALCERNPKLADLDSFFNASGTDGTFHETYGGNDTETNTDNSARRTKTEFNGVDDPTSQSTSDSIVVEPVEGKNTTERKTEYGKTRTYADGRTWSQILADVMDTRGPVYLFINSFAQILREPAEDTCDMPVYPPSMQMKVNVNTIPAGDPATASVTNQGTLYNAIFDVLFNIPQGESGIAALMSTYTLKKESDPNVNDQITFTAENFSTYFSRDPVIDDRCIFVAKNTSTGESFILGVTCTTKNESVAVFTVVSIASTAPDLSLYAKQDGNYSGLGAGYLETVYVGLGTASIGWWKIGAVSLSDITSIANTTSLSTIILINGIYGDQGQTGTTPSGAVEFDVRCSNGAFSYATLSVLWGNLSINNLCAVVSENEVVLYCNIDGNYRAAQFMVLAEHAYAGTVKKRPFVFSTTYYGSTAPDGAVYAFVRNNASALSLSSAVGSSTQPVYFNADGVPVACGDSLAVSITGNADTAYSATSALSAARLGGVEADQYALKTNVNSVSMVPYGGQATTLSALESGGVYSISANGYLRIAYQTTAADNFISMSQVDSSGNAMWGALSNGQKLYGSGYPFIYMPVAKGDHIKVDFSSSVNIIQVQLIKVKTV